MGRLNGVAMSAGHVREGRLAGSTAAFHNRVSVHSAEGRCHDVKLVGCAGGSVSWHFGAGRAGPHVCPCGCMYTSVRRFMCATRDSVTRISETCVGGAV